MDYKSTLLIPKTEFPMRGNLPNKEPVRQKQWESDQLYEQVQERTKGRPTFILHDGPPYANGDIHTGHALNKILKDFITRYKAMAGYHAPYVPGWDTHGLPIETALAQKKVDRKKLSIVDFRKKCEEYALEQVDRQREQFKQLGVLSDWDNPYITLTKEYVSGQIHVFGEMAKKGYIYRGLRPVYWSPSSESALAEAEIEYHDKRSPSIYFTLEVTDGKGLLQGGEKFIVWTTTPWTIPANLGISIHPNLAYVVVAVENEKYVVAKDLVEVVAEELDWDEYKIVQTFKGEEADRIVASHPFYEQDSLVMLGEHVTIEAGTGCVHTAPGHGEDDFYVCQRYGIEAFCPVDEFGYFTEEAPGFENVYYDDGNKLVSEKLKANGALLKLKFITHSYPHDWRTKKPTIFRATSQWFASIKDFRLDILSQIKEVNWHPHWGETRLYNMVRDRQDWCISRQRTWGVPIPVFYAEDSTPIISDETISHVAQLFAEHGANIWFEWEADDLLPEGFTSEHSPNGVFVKETDIMDVWFDSGSSHEAVLEARENLHRPADLYLEGSDQYRGWFNSSISTAVAITGKSPYKTVLSHGFVLDGDGRKMSKSLGNVVDPAKVQKQLGADILRLWVSSVDYQSDVRISDDILKQVSEAYRKIRNTFRFILGNLGDYNPIENRVADEDLQEADRYMLYRLQEVVKEVHEAYDAYEFSDVYHLIHNFCSIELSSFYLDFAKDILYIESVDHPRRRSIQTVYYEALTSLVKLIAPLIPHTAEEIWGYIEHKEADYVQLTDLPVAREIAEVDVAKWGLFMQVRDDVLKALEEARDEKVIGKSLEAKITIVPKDDEVKTVLEGIPFLHQLCIVSEANVVTKDPRAKVYRYVDVYVEKQSGERCDRCWIVTDSVGEDESHPTLCTRCAEIVEEHYV